MGARCRQCIIALIDTITSLGDLKTDAFRERWDDAVRDLEDYSGYSSKVASFCEFSDEFYKKLREIGRELREAVSAKSITGVATGVEKGLELLTVYGSDEASRFCQRISKML